MNNIEKITLSVMVLNNLVDSGKLDGREKVIATELMIKLMEKLETIQ